MKLTSPCDVKSIPLRTCSTKRNVVIVADMGPGRMSHTYHHYLRELILTIYTTKGCMWQQSEPASITMIRTSTSCKRGRSDVDLRERHLLSF